MKRLMSNIWVSRLILLLFGLSLFLAGLRRLLAGGLHYRNYWGGLVFAPFAMLVGLFLLGLVVFRWRTLNEVKPREKLRGRAARRARRAEATKFPIDDYRKW